MASCFLTLVTLASLLISQVRAASSLQLSRVSSTSCETQYTSGGTQPTPVPTVESTSTMIFTSTISTITTPSIVIQYAATSTTTQETLTSATITIATVTSPTLTQWVQAYTTFATATWPSTVCTNSVTPSSVTEYTGAPYTPISGQDTAVPATYANEVVCSGGVTSYYSIWPIVTSGTITRTSTPVSTVYAYTTTITNTITYATETVWATTVTSTTTAFDVAYTVATTSTACEETYTTTYDTKCAPTNLIAALNGDAIVGSGIYPYGTGVSYGPDVPGDQYHTDASLCCQLCLDNDGCGAMMAGPAFDAACGLLYVWNATSGGPEYDELVFSYLTAPGKIPGQSLIVQSGDGLITYLGDE